MTEEERTERAQTVKLAGRRASEQAEVQHTKHFILRVWYFMHRLTKSMPSDLFFVLRKHMSHMQFLVYWLHVEGQTHMRTNVVNTHGFEVSNDHIFFMESCDEIGPESFWLVLAS